jgi:hypothetical protein
MRLRWPHGIALTLPCALWLLAPACAQVTDTGTSTSTSTLVGQPIIEIDPAIFLGTTILCADTPGAMRSYVVTFIDMGPATGTMAPAAGFPVALPSSPPTPCSQKVSLTNTVAGHRYAATVDGYEQSAHELSAKCSQEAAYARCLGEDADGKEAKAPEGGGVCQQNSECVQHGCYGYCLEQPAQKWALITNPLTGSYYGCASTQLADGGLATKSVCFYEPVIGDRHMVDAKTYAAVTPRWRTPDNQPCDYDVLTVSQPFQRVELQRCSALIDSGTPGATSIRVEPHTALGTYACYAAPTPDAGASGTVNNLEVVPDPASGLVAHTVSCASKKTVTYASGVTGGQSYTFTLQAFEEGQAEHTLEAPCFATAIAGATVVAKCDPLAPKKP